MKRYLKIIGIVAGIFFLLLVAAAVIVPLVVDPNDYKDRIVAVVQKQTGRTLKIQGDIALSVFPWLGVKLGAVELGNAPGFEAPVFAGMEQLQVRVRILPLLSKRVEADVVAVRGLTINLERNGEGRTNWDDLVKTESAEKSREGQAPQGTVGMEALAIGGVDVRDASLTWTDRVSGQRISLTELVLETSEVSLADPVDVKIGFSLDTGDLGVNGRVDTASRVRIDLSQERYRIEDLQLGADLKGKGLPGGSTTIKLSGAAALDAPAGKLDLERLKVEAGAFGGKTSTVLETSGGGDLNAGKFELKNLKVDFAMAGEPDPIKASLTGKVMADLNAQKIDVSSLAIDGMGMKAAGGLSVQNFSSPDVRFDLAADRIDMDSFLPAKRDAGTPPAPVPASVAKTEAFPPLPVDALRNLLLDGKLRVSDLSAFGLKMHGVAVGIRAKEGVIRMDPVSAALYDGQFTGAVELDVRRGETRLRFEEKLADARVDRLLKDLEIDAGKVDMSGPSTMSLKGSAAADPSFKVIRAERFAIEGNLGGRLPFALEGDGSQLTLHDQTLTIEGLKARLDQLTLRGKTKISGASGKPSFTAQLSVPAFNPRKLLATLGQPPLETVDPKALTVVELAASVSGSRESLSVDGLKARLDDTRMEGRLGIKQLPSAAYAFDIQVDALDLDRYLPPAKKSAKPEAGTPSAAATASPLEPLRTLNLDGKLAVGKLKIANARLQDIRLQASGKDGLLTLHPVGASLYGGTYNGNVAVDARGQQPRIALDEKIAGVQIGQLLADLQGRAPLTGTTSAAMKLTATGLDADAISRTLNGNVGFQLVDGSIEGVDILGKICRTLSAVRAGSLKKEDIAAGLMQMVKERVEVGEKKGPERTVFSDMRGSMVFADGVGANKDLVLNSPLLRVEGAGKMDLVNRRLDYQATAALVKSCEGQGGKSLVELANYPIPVSVTGPLDNPEVKPDLTAGILKLLQGSKAEDQAAPAPASGPQPSEPPKEPPKKLEDAAKDLLQKGMQDLFKKK